MNFFTNAKQFKEEIKEKLGGGSPILMISFGNNPSQRFRKHCKCLASVMIGMMEHLSLVRDRQPTFGKTLQANVGGKLLRDATKENRPRLGDI